MNPDFRDMLSAFNAEGVEYLVVGAYALAAHGLPRATGELGLEDLERPDVVFQVGVVPRRVDVLTGIDGVEFATAWPDCLTASLADLDVPVISREHLIRNKRACARPQDIADLAWLERAT